MTPETYERTVASAAYDLTRAVRNLGEGYQQAAMNEIFQRSMTMLRGNNSLVVDGPLTRWVTEDEINTGSTNEAGEAGKGDETV